MPAGLNTYTSEPSWQDVAWRAVRAHKADQDIWELSCTLALLDQLVRPQTVLEVGSLHGGSLWAWDQLPSVQRLVSVTLPLADAAGRTAVTIGNLTTVYADSQDDLTLPRTLEALGGHQPDLVVIDGNHTYQAARHDLLTYGGLVAPGGAIVLHDIAEVPQHPEVRVSQLWAEVAPRRPSVAIIACQGQLPGTGIIWA